MNVKTLMHGTCAGVLLTLALTTTLEAQTATVDTVEDRVDFGGQQQVGDLPGPDGRVSFREAVTAVNNTPGPQTIAFAIPVSEYWLDPRLAHLKQEGGTFVLDDNDTTIDFSTQSDFAGDTNPDGGEVGCYGLQPNGWGAPFMSIYADGCTIKGLDEVLMRGYGVSIIGSKNRVIGCTISGPLYAAVAIAGLFGGAPASNNTVGGTLPGEGNRLSGGNSGVRIDGPSLDNVVVGNILTGSFAGIELRGAYDNDPVGTRIGGPTAAERNVIAGAGHYGEEGFPVGEQVSLSSARDTLIQGNLIGTDEAGTRAAPQIGPAGIEVRDSTDTTILDNVVSGLLVRGSGHHAGELFGSGIWVTGASQGTLVLGNRVGTDLGGTLAIENLNGIVVAEFTGRDIPADTTVGGTGQGEGNIVAFNRRNGVVVGALTGSVRISGNAIHSNGALGIELRTFAGDDGVTANDPGDGDTMGGNALQNFPVLLEARLGAGRLRVIGTLDSHPGEAYDIELFAVDTCDPSGHGEGRRYLGSTTMTIGGGPGHTAFTADLPAPTESPILLSATATRRATGETSEFAACIPVKAGAVRRRVLSR